MKWKLVPYIFIVVFCLAVGVVRSFFIESWHWHYHVLAFFLQFIFLTACWLAVRAISIYLDKKFPFENGVLKRIVLQVIIAFILIAPIYAMLLFNYDRLDLPFMNRQFVALVSILFFVFILFMNLGHNAFYFFKQWQKSVEEKAQLQIQAAELKMDKSMIQYHHLKNQVNPHFLFNTLTSLDGLIHTEPDLASDFIQHLSKVYRYVLEHKENEVVSLQTEIEFIQHYISLLRLRYKEVLKIHIDISAPAMEKGIMMVTLQMLIDNAIKHNSLQPDTPLIIDIRDEGGYLHIQNNKQLRKQIETSNNQGLRQLKELYRYLSQDPVIIESKNDMFKITLPLL